jgi:hypothetical protein
MARRTGAKNHIHRYFKMPNGLWACSLDECTHYMPANVAFRMLGIKSICWECSGEMRLDEDSMKLEKPTCPRCADPELGNIQEYLKQKGL